MLAEGFAYGGEFPQHLLWSCCGFTGVAEDAVPLQLALVTLPLLCVFMLLVRASCVLLVCILHIVGNEVGL